MIIILGIVPSCLWYINYFDSFTDSYFQSWVDFNKTGILIRELLQHYLVIESLPTLLKNLVFDRVSEVTIDSLFKLVDVLGGENLILLHETFNWYGHSELNIFGIDIRRCVVNNLDVGTVAQLVVAQFFAFYEREAFVFELDVPLVQTHVLTADHFCDLFNGGILFDI